MNNKIFIVEDDSTISEILKLYLEKWGFESSIICDFNKVIEEFSNYDPSLVLLDISLPFYNGYHWCGEIRKISNVPIIFISSHSENMNQVMAMNMGADDFISKPFDLELVVAKIKALLRRAYDSSNIESFIKNDGVILDLATTKVIFNNNEIELTKNEFKIMQIIFENAGNVITREKIMKFLWDDESFVDDNTLTVNINRLRKKLESIELNNGIKTKKGLGYVWEK